MITKDYNKYEDFVLSFSSDNTRRVYRSYSKLGEYDYTNCDMEAVENAILSVNPQSITSISVACTILRKYAEFINNENLAIKVNNIDRKQLWERAKPNGRKKYISHSQYKTICEEIVMWEEHNPLYYKTLFMAIYEGIFSNDMSVIKNLRLRDLDGNKVILHPDNEDEYSFDVSKELIENLKELSTVTTWAQKGRYGNIQIPLQGCDDDSIFKTVRRDTTENKEDGHNILVFYSRRIREISKEYVKHALIYYDLYISGLTYRIQQKLNAKDITLQDALSPRNRDSIVRQVFADELSRSHYPNKVSNFRELIRCHLDVFLEKI